MTGTFNWLKISKICWENFEKKWAKLQTGQPPHLPKWGLSPPNKKYFCHGPWDHNMQCSVWGRWSPKGVNSKKWPTPKIYKPHFLENKSMNFFSIWEIKDVPSYYDFHTTDSAPPVHGRCRPTIKKDFHFGGQVPKFDPRPHVPQNLSRALRGQAVLKKFRRWLKWLLRKSSLNKLGAP